MRDQDHVILVDPVGAGSLLASQLWRSRRLSVHCVQNLGELAVVLEAWPESVVVADTLLGTFPDEVMHAIASLAHDPLELVTDERQAEVARRLGWRPIQWPDSVVDLPDVLCCAVLAGDRSTPRTGE